VLWPQELQEERSGLKEAATQEEQAWEAKEDRVKWRFRAGNVIADGRGQAVLHSHLEAWLWESRG
jgi:hypothetical protein